MNYGDLIGAAFRITWRNRYLWFFGLFISGGAASINASVPPSPEGSTGSAPGGLLAWLSTSAPGSVGLLSAESTW